MWRFVRERELVPTGATVLVGVSGGPDSVCLLHLLSRLRDKQAVSLHVAHLNHLLRGTESDSDAQCVSRLARRMGIAATVASRDVKSYQLSHHCSLEEAAREVRYAFLAEVAGQVGASRVAVGHTLDDQVETILLHLIRGSGVAGLRGMHAATRWHSQATGASLLLIRPLLMVSREETAEYCLGHGLSTCEDLSNRSASLLRNRVRSELLPLLRSFNSNIDTALLRT
ncbi:MAG: tRNA lysidine(34) synthetase TilS, partial [Chloroflexota bacterium]